MQVCYILVPGWFCFTRKKTFVSSSNFAESSFPGENRLTQKEKLGKEGQEGKERNRQTHTQKEKNRGCAQVWKRFHTFNKLCMQVARRIVFKPDFFQREMTGHILSTRRAASCSQKMGNRFTNPSRREEQRRKKTIFMENQTDLYLPVNVKTICMYATATLFKICAYFKPPR